MIGKQRIIQEIESLSPEYFEEVLTFVGYLKSKKKSFNSVIPETALLSEKALAKDWLSSEEDEAWGSL